MEIIVNNNKSEIDQIEDQEAKHHIVRKIIKDTGSSNQIDLDEAIACTTHALQKQSITTEHLSKEY